MSKIFAGVVLVGTIVLSGCSGSSAEDVAVEFGEALSDLDMQKAKSLAVNDKIVEKLEKSCLEQMVHDVTRDVQKAFRSASKKHKKELEEFGKNMREKYPNIQELSDEEKKEIIEDSSVEFIDILLADAKYKKIATKVMQQVLLSEYSGGKSSLNKLVKDVVGKDSENYITDECVMEYSAFGNIDDINVIETKEISADESRVKLEIVHDDGNSQKVSVDLEKIQDEWKVQDPSFKLAYFW